VTDACLKRKVRNYVEMVGKDEPTPERYKIFVEEGSVLNEKISRAYTAVGLPQKEGTPEQQLQVAKWMQQNFYDLRMFGAVLSTGLKAGQVWGPMQISFSRSIDPVFPQSVSITRCAATEEKEKKDGVKKDNKTMGRKEVLPYGLYKSHVFYNPHLAEKSGCVNERDLDLFWQALIKAWEFDRSSARGFMACRGLYVFTHASKYGNAPVHQLFDKLQIKSTVDVPRSFADYQVDLDEVLPDGVTLTKLA
jgi:CRISPR-associated protein Csd2